MSTDDDTYVHRPGETDGATTGTDDVTAGSDDAGDGLGRQGWVLVGVVVLSVLVVPGVIYLYPAGPGNLGVPFLTAMLVLPMVPALLLGAAAVWSLKVGD